MTITHIYIRICDMYISCSYTRVVSPTIRCFVSCGFPFAIKSVDRKGLTDFRQLGEAEALLFTAGKHLGGFGWVGPEVYVKLA